MSLSKYFASSVSVSLELLAAVCVRADVEIEEEILALVPQNEKPRFQVLLSSLRQLPVELQHFMSQKVLAQYAASTSAGYRE